MTYRILVTPTHFCCNQCCHFPLKLVVSFATQDQYLLSDEDPSVERHLKELLAERPEEQRDKSATTSWQSLHMSVAEKRVQSLIN